MSIYAQFDDGEQKHLASNLGWSEFCQWAESLDSEQFPEVLHLSQHGWEQELESLIQQLEQSPEPESENVGSTRESLIAILSGRGTADVLLVTDGMGPDDAAGEE